MLATAGHEPFAHSRPGADTLPAATPVPALRMVPNPVKNRCELQALHFENGVAWVTIVNTAGATVYREKRLLVTAADRVILFLRLPPGNYYCFVTQGQKKARVLFAVSE